MKLLLLFITIIFCIIQNVIAIYNKDIFLPKCDSLYIEEAYIGPNKEEHVRRCRYRPDRNRIYCDFSWDTNLYLSIPVKVFKSPTIKDGIKVNRFSLKRCNNKVTRSLAVTSIGEKFEKGDTSLIPLLILQFGFDDVFGMVKIYDFL